MIMWQRQHTSAFYPTILSTERQQEPAAVFQVGTSACVIQSAAEGQGGVT